MDDEGQLERLNEGIMNKINASGQFFLSHTKLRGKYTIRVAIGNIRTTEQDVRELWELVRLTSEAVRLEKAE